MFLKIKKIKSKLTIGQAKRMYLLFDRRKKLIQIKNEKLIKKNILFLLTTIFERDIFSSETCNIDAVFMLGKYDLKLSKDLIGTLSKNQYLVFKIGKSLNFNSFLNNKNIKSILIYIFEWVFKSCLSLIDLFLIIFYTLIKALINNFENFKKQKKKNISCKELYTFFYWNDRKMNSITHYFPDYFLRKDKKAFVSMVSRCRFLMNGILSFYKYPDLINHFDFVNIKDLFKTINDLIYLYYADIFYRRNFTYGDIIAIANSLKLINRRFFSLLIYHIFPKIIKDIKPSKLYLWHENQFQHRALSLSILKIEKDLQLIDLTIYTYLGTTFFSLDYWPHLVPTRIELKYKLWCKNNFMLQDIGSKNEINNLLNKFSIEFTSQVARKSLKRSKSAKNKLEGIDYLKSEKRDFTFFAHANQDEFFIMIFRFFEKYKSSKILLKKSVFHIRLHPLLSISDALNQIERLKENVYSQYLNFKFINGNNESIEESIRKSDICIFSQSSLVNIALEHGAKVIAIRTSYFFDPPIQSKFKKYKNLSVF